MRFTWARIAFAILLAAGWAASSPAMAQDGGSVVDMPSEDRAMIDKFLGKGVLGKAVASEPLGDPLEYIQYDKDASFGVKITCGEDQGKVIKHSIKILKPDTGEKMWEVTAGNTDTLKLKISPKGNLVFLNHAEPDEGLDGHYSPHPPLLIKGMEPGSTFKHDFEISVRYLDDPDKEKHHGHLTLNLTYLGTFEMDLPIGKHPAVAIKSEYIGKVGPAKLDDAQYRFFVKGVGVVAMIEEKDISAFLVYSDQEKVGKLLLKPE